LQRLQDQMTLLSTRTPVPQRAMERLQARIDATQTRLNGLTVQ
jgi:hypothetical protein